MRYLSVCSGIEAASVAWHHLGWQPVGFSEIEPFPSAVLAHRFPSTPNFGDMTKHEQWPLGLGSIDLLVGGTPCQSFSVAGLRKGLHDPRGGLMLTYLEIARRLRPRWVVWENVPGVLSSGRGRDFGSFLGALGELGYGWAYRVLDAQWIRTQRHPRAVPQRRRRVFVVGCSGDGAAAAAVLFERESVCRDSAPRRAPREGAPADAEGCSGTVSSKWAKGTGGPAGDECYNLTTQTVSSTLGNRGLRSHTELDGHGAYVPVMSIQGAATRANPASGPDGIGVSQSGVSYTLEARSEVQAVAHPVPTHAVLGTDCYNGAITGDVAATMGTPGSSVNASGPTVMTTVAMPVDLQNAQMGGDVAGTLDTTRPSRGGGQAVAFANRTRDGIKVPEVMADGIVPALTNPGDGGRSDAINVAVAFHPTQDPISSSESFHAIGTGNKTGCATAAVAQAMTVRRLTPRECERLQGFPDDWTMIPWRKKGAEECPDGPRYRALGNSMAVNVMAWIGERIDNYERTRNAVRTEG